jgi:C-terminal processing protease CtpA/Prc
MSYTSGSNESAIHRPSDELKNHHDAHSSQPFADSAWRYQIGKDIVSLRTGSSKTNAGATDTNPQPTKGSDAADTASPQPSKSEAADTASPQPPKSDAADTASPQPPKSDAADTASPQPPRSDAADTASPQPPKSDAAAKSDESDKPVTQPQPDITIDDATRKEVIDNLAKEISDNYIFPDVAAKVVKMLRDNESSGAYDKITSGAEFAKTLTDEMQAASGDKHFSVVVANSDIPKETPDSNPITPAVLDRIKAADYGIASAKVLPGNIGYLSISSFEPAEVADVAKAIDSAMSSLAGTDSLIIDMRNNAGGDFNTVLKVLDHLLNPNTHVNDIYWRADNRTDSSVTSAPAVSPTFGPKKDVYVLTSNKTFSSGEELSYDLQALKRATVVGDTTGGGADPGHFERLSSRFFGFIPSGEAINPTTKTNWEGTGVQPDVKVPAAEAFRTAYKMAIDKAISTETDPARLAELKAKDSKIASSLNGSPN